MNVTILLLDGESFEEKNLRKITLGKELFKNTCKKIGLTEETDYFGLRFVNKQDGEFQWIDNDRSLKSQLGKEASGSITNYLNFAVKFFPVNPTNIKQDFTRYQFVLQLRESLLSGRLECPVPIYALLGSFIVQAEYGDYDPGEHGKNYLDDFKFCPEQPPELIAKVREYHMRHKGMTPEQAELGFLDNVRKLPMYGVHRHVALDVNSEKVYIGVSNLGITVYRGSRLMSKFVWPKILSVRFKSKKFYIKIKPADEDDQFCKTSVGFKLASRVAAKRLWKMCVEHHTFFRLENVDLAEKKGLLSRFASPFRYRGKTQNEIMKEQPGPEEPFSRVSSKRFSERVLKSNRKQTEDAKPEAQAEVPPVPPSTPKKDVTDAPPGKVPVIEVKEVVAPSKVDEVQTEPEVKNTGGLPKINVVEASPELKVKPKEDDAAATIEIEKESEAEKGEEVEKDKDVEKEKEVEKENEVEKEREVEKENEVKKENEVDKEKEVEMEKEVEKDNKVEKVEETESPDDSPEDDKEERGSGKKELSNAEEPIPLNDEETQLVITNPLVEGGLKSYTSHTVTTTTYTTQSSTDDGDSTTFGTSSTVISSTEIVTTSETKQETVTTSSATKTLLERSMEENSST